jgi:hypothetical protein
MFWKFLLVVALGLILFKFGSYSILVNLFIAIFKVAVFLALGAVAFVVWRKYQTE